MKPGPKWRLTRHQAHCVRFFLNFDIHHPNLLPASIAQLFADNPISEIEVNNPLILTVGHLASDLSLNCLVASWDRFPVHHVTGTPSSWTEGQTRLKTLPSLLLRMRVVKRDNFQKGDLPRWSVDSLWTAFFCKRWEYYDYVTIHSVYIFPWVRHCCQSSYRRTRSYYSCRWHIISCSYCYTLLE